MNPETVKQLCMSIEKYGFWKGVLCTLIIIMIITSIALTTQIF